MPENKLFLRKIIIVMEIFCKKAGFPRILEKKMSFRPNKKRAKEKEESMLIDIKKLHFFEFFQPNKIKLKVGIGQLQQPPIMLESDFTDIFFN